MLKTLFHRNLYALGVSNFNSLFITRVSMPDQAHARITGEHSLETPVTLFRSVGHHDHAGVLRKADSDAAPVMNRNPGSAGGCVDERVKQRPIGNSVRAVAHAFRFAIW